jgi:hypothetical protein
MLLWQLRSAQHSSQHRQLLTGHTCIKESNQARYASWSMQYVVACPYVRDPQYRV